MIAWPGCAIGYHSATQSLSHQTCFDWAQDTGVWQQQSCPAWCLDDKLVSTQYETITPTQVLSGTFRQGLMRKETEKIFRKLSQRVTVFCCFFFKWNRTLKHKYKAVFFKWYLDAHICLSSQQHLDLHNTCLSKKETNFYKLMIPKIPFLLWQQLEFYFFFFKWDVWNENLLRMSYFHHFLFSCTANNFTCVNAPLSQKLGCSVKHL